MLTMIMTATMIATGGFGAFPPNELTRQAAQLASESFPPDIIAPINRVLEQLAAPTLEVIERPDSNNGHPVVEFIESLVEPIFTALPVATTETVPAGITPENTATRTENPATATLKINATTTQALPPSPSITLKPPTLSPSPTARPSPTTTFAPTWTVIYVPPTPTKTRQPPPADTFTPVPSAMFTSTGTPSGTPTVTSTPSPVPSGHLITSVSLNGGGNSITVVGGATVTMNYDYQVWGDSFSCPGCNFQLLWGLDNNWQTCYGWISPSPGDYPGQSGNSLTSGMTVNITAPTTPGTYTIYSFSGQYADCVPLIAAYSSASATPVGTITVSCTAGLTLVMSANDGATYNLDWDGANWSFASSGGVPGWCSLYVTNNSASALSGTFTYPGDVCTPSVIPAGGGTASIMGDNSLGQCPVKFYAP